MTYQCPACQRSFAEPGFCPFDGNALAPLENADKPTVLSSFHAAQSAADQETVMPSERDKRTHPGAGVGQGTGPVKAVSAAQSKTYALDNLREALSEYDRLVGETLDGRYYVQRKIGEGGMGVVFAVKHTVIERPLAIKVLKREVMRDEGTLRRFVQEAKAASRIGHPNIVDVTDFGKTPEGMTYSVMEYVDGTTLSKAIKHSAPFPAERTVNIAMQIARALGAAHDKGIVHRDLKPENVFLTDREGRPDFVKIVDFGIAKVQPVEGRQEGPRLTRAGSVFGTPEYMAPEQAAGRSDTDRRVDIYALGTIMYEMLLGRVPHKGDSMIRTIAMQMLDPITPLRQVNPDLPISPGLEAVIMKALAKNRDERFATMNELIAAIDALHDELTASNPTLSLPPLPPGADPSLTPVPSVPVAHVTGHDAPPAGGPPRRSKGETRPLHEPEFVGAPLTFNPVFDTPPEDDTRRRWPMVLLALLLLAVGAGGMIWLLGRTQHQDETPPPPPRALDAAVIAQQADAAVITELTDDAGVPPADATDIVVVPLDAGHARDAGAGLHPKTVRMTVYVRPGDAGVYIGTAYRGPANTTIEEPYGKKIHIECKTANMKGSVDVVFDGQRESVMCTATRQRFCVEGIKNPFDDCEQRPE
ncbi:MAG: serine/threonine protein kinase [Deltaproteobacteria bacterium]|nr:serine/threonine protein kinase [Deltaproteobacteria bacterium]